MRPGTRASIVVALLGHLACGGDTTIPRAPAPTTNSGTAGGMQVCVASNMHRLAALGLSVNISEMDGRIRDRPAQTKLEMQRSVYRSAVGICVARPRCDGVTFWGFTDAYSWIDAQFGADDPRLVDDLLVPHV